MNCNIYIIFFFLYVKHCKIQNYNVMNVTLLKTMRLLFVFRNYIGSEFNTIKGLAYWEYIFSHVIGSVFETSFVQLDFYANDVFFFFSNTQFVKNVNFSGKKNRICFLHRTSGRRPGVRGTCVARAKQEKSPHPPRKSRDVCVWRALFAVHEFRRRTTATPNVSRRHHENSVKRQ